MTIANSEGVAMFLASAHNKNIAIWMSIRKRQRKPCSTGVQRIKRIRKSVYQIHRELGAAMFRRSFRMSIDLFFKLYNRKDLPKT